MPTIEIVSINAIELQLIQDDFDIAIIEENKLNSHRSLFFNFLQQNKGVIIHIGNPELKKEKETGFFGGQIIDWNFEPEEETQCRFKFLEKHKNDIDRLLKIALEKSPIKKILFLTDYQFGPEKESIELINTITNFWERHDNEGIEFNKLYEMSR
jgi:hypothetical protein